MFGPWALVWSLWTWTMTTLFKELFPLPHFYQKTLLLHWKKKKKETWTLSPSSVHLKAFLDLQLFVYLSFCVKWRIIMLLFFHLSLNLLRGFLFHPLPGSFISPSILLSYMLSSLVLPTVLNQYVHICYLSCCFELIY